MADDDRGNPAMGLIDWGEYGILGNEEGNINYSVFRYEKWVLSMGLS